MAETHDDDPVVARSRIDLRTLPSDGGERYNRLIFEKSPYLLQHAEDPVDWYPWSEEAFGKARREDKPIFLSIGYSTCHWCHVMAEESFADPVVAAILKRHFVAIKVDREERPDIDRDYMTVCQLMTGSGGWPLTLVLTPDKKPFFAATYLSRTPRGDQPGIIPILERLAELWRDERQRMSDAGEQAARAVGRLDAAPTGSRPLGEAPLREALAHYRREFDATHGGFGTAPKFPTPHNLSLLLRLGRRFADSEATNMALKTLQSLRLGGIYDHVGFGLHRYAVDAAWRVPHFEKMLYDQALFVIACIDAYQVSGAPLFAQSAREVLSYLSRELTDPNGGFYCGEDADSQGEEGTFYLWTPAEVEAVLGGELATIFCHSYDITDEGNFEGKNIPHLALDLDILAAKIGVDANELTGLLGAARERLFAARNLRPRPHRDDKILTGWNGLAIAAFARAGAVLAEPVLTGAAAKAAGFIGRTMHGGGGLLRRFRQGEAAIPAMLEDYAFFVYGLCELYAATFVGETLAEAVVLNDEMLERFGDGAGGLFDTADGSELILARGRTLQDGALPSPAAVATTNLLRLGQLTGLERLTAAGEKLLRANLTRVEAYPHAYAQSLIALDFALGPGTEIVLAPGDGEPPEAFLTPLRQRFAPATTVLLTPDGPAFPAGLAPAAAGKAAVDGHTTAWVCRDRSCLPPVTSVAGLLELLDA
jgi:uncharacterized protein YyaL (SSP411 family)